MQLVRSQGGEVMEDKSRVTRKRKEKESNNQKWKNRGVATFKFSIGLGRGIDCLARLWEFLSNF